MNALISNKPLCRTCRKLEGHRSMHVLQQATKLTDLGDGLKVKHLGSAAELQVSLCLHLCKTDWSIKAWCTPFSVADKQCPSMYIHVPIILQQHAVLAQLIQ